VSLALGGSIWSSCRLVVGAQEGDDLADGWLVGQHAGVALVLVQEQAGVGMRSAVSRNSSGE
jgi:hypothetical protein